MGWKPIGSVYDTVRKRWFGPGDILADKDWLPRLYAREFEHTDEQPNVTEQATLPTPPPPAPGGGSDPRVDQILADIERLKQTPPGGTTDPRVDGLTEKLAVAEGIAKANQAALQEVSGKVGQVEASVGQVRSTVDEVRGQAVDAGRKAQTAIESATQATAKAGVLEGQMGVVSRKADGAEAKAGQAEAAASQAGNKAEQANTAAASLGAQVAGLDAQVKANTAGVSRAEQKAGSAESKAIGAQNIARQATTTVAEVKKVTDPLAPLKVHETYQQVRADAQLGKQNADNATIIAQAASNKVTALEQWKEGMPSTEDWQAAEEVLQGLDLGSINHLIQQAERVDFEEVRQAVRQLKDGLSPKLVKVKDIRKGDDLGARDKGCIYLLRNPVGNHEAEFELIPLSGWGAPDTTVEVGGESDVYLIAEDYGCVVLSAPLKRVRNREESQTLWLNGATLKSDLPNPLELYKLSFGTN